MSKTLSILFLEDSPKDAEIAVMALGAAGYECRWDRVETRKDFLERLLSPDYDVVISDYKLPSFDGITAVKLFVEYGFDIPFILISGMLGEEAAVESLKAGATDFVLKDKLFRLPQVVARALEEREKHRQIRQAEQKVRQQATALESAANAILITDAEGLITSVNPAFTKLTGYTEKEVVGKNPRIFRSGEHDPAFYKNLWETILSGKIWRGEMVNLRRDGSRYFEEQTIAPVMNDAGQIDGFVAIKQDISARRRAEGEVRLPATVLRAGLVSFLLLVILESVEMYLSRFVGEEIATGLPVVVGSFAAGVITYFVLKKQKLMYLRTLEEVKERERAEKAQAALNFELEAERLRLENIIASVPGVVWEAWGEPDAASDRTDYVSDYIEAMVGYSVEEWLATPNFWLTIVHPDDRERTARDAAAAFAAGKSNNVQEFRWIAKDGNAIWVESHAATIFDQNGAPAGLRGVTIDITERKRAEVERRIISQIIQGAVDTPNLSEFLAFVHRSISKIMYAENCFVMLHDPVNDIDQFEFWVDKFDPPPPPQPAGRGFASYVLRTGMPLRITEESRKRIIDAGEAELVGTYSPSWVGVPLRTPQRTIGVLVLQHYEDENAYSERDLEFLSAVGDQIARAIERKQADEALIESEERYRDLIENATDIIFTHDLDGNYTSANRAAEKTSGYTRKEMLAMNVAQVVAPEYQERAAQMLAAKLSGKRITAYELEIVAKDGRRIMLEVSSRLTMSNGVPVGVHGIGRDITERKRAEEAISALRRELELMMNSMAEGVHRMDASGTIVFENAAAARMLGWKIEELVGRPGHETIHHTRADGTPYSVEDCPIHATLRDGISRHTTDEVFWRQDGNSFPVDYTTAPVRNDQNEIIASVVTFSDITERKQAEAALKGIHDQLVKIVATTPGIVSSFRLRPDGSACFPFGGERVAEHYGVLPARLAEDAAPFFAIVHPDDLTDLHESVAESARSLKPWRHEWRVLHPVRGELWIEAHSMPVREPDGGTLWQGVTTDITERKQADEALRESEERFRKVFEDGPLGIVMANLEDGRFTVVNKAFCEMLGYTEREMKQFTSADVTHPDDRARDVEAIRQMIDGRIEEHRIEKRYLRKNGDVFWGSRALTKISGADGTPLYALAMIEDITERKRASEKLKLFRALVDHSDDTVEVVDPETGRFLDVNETGCRDTGYSREEYLALTVFDIDPTSDPATFAEVMEEIRRSGGLTWDGIHRRKDGSIFPVEVNLKIVSLDREYLVAIVRDITERRRAEEELIRSQERYRDLVENASDIIYTHDLDGNYTSVNSAVERITGYTLEEALGMNIAQSVAPEYLKTAKEMIVAKISGDKVTAYELEIIAKDGHRVTVEVNTRIIREGGIPVGVQGIARDVTERKQLEDQFRQAQKMESVGILAGGIAHDFNNLLTAINGYSALTLRRMDESDPFRRSIEEIRNAGERAAALTEQLLAFSRKKVLQPTVHNLNPLISDLEKMLRRIIREDVELRTVLEPELGNIQADPAQMEQIILNLSVNARDAMPNGGTLTIETQNVYLDKDYVSQHMSVSPGPFVRLSVSDTGHGMDETTQERIFDPFFTTKKMGEGTGLGLSMVFGIVKQSGGDIMVYSEVGRGTTFKIYFPRVEKEVDKPTSTGDSEANFPGTETILLVEDEAAVRSLASEVLRSHGYNILEAASGKEALSLCAGRSGPIHLLLSDVIMPKMNGPQIRDLIVESIPDIKVLFMSGYTDGTISTTGILDPATGFIEKPFSPEDLVRKVRELLDA